MFVQMKEGLSANDISKMNINYVSSLHSDTFKLFFLQITVIVVNEQQSRCKCQLLSVCLFVCFLFQVVIH